MNPKVSVLIVDYKKADRVVRNVESLAGQSVNFDIEVLILDNSCDPSNSRTLKPLTEYHGVRLFTSKKNLGYARGNNEIARLAQGKYLLLLNPDVLWKEPDTLQKMVAFMDEYPKIGLCGPRQLNETSGTAEITVRAWPRISIQVARRTFLRHVPGLRGRVEYDEMRHLDPDKTQTVDWLQSSFWLVRENVWEELGGLSEEYFLFMADPDFCHRCWEQGHEVVYFPEASVLADGKRASAGGMREFFSRWTLRQHLKEAVRYSVKHFRKPDPHQAYIERLPDQEVLEA